MHIKNIFKAIGSGFMMLALTACGDAGHPKEVLTTKEGEKIMQEQENKILVVYFSRSGRTRQVAHWIQETAKADLIEIKTVTPYPAEYYEVVNVARKEIKDGVKPALTTEIKNFAKYDKIFIGTPNWWSTMAPPVATLLSNYDFSEKTIIPFVTHGGGGEADCISDMKKLCPKANFKEAMVLRDNKVPNAQDKVVEWAQNSVK